MNESLIQFLAHLKSLPLSKKISISFVILLVVVGFTVMFTLANQEEYQALFSNLSPSDGGAIVTKLKEQGVPYRVEANGTMIMVPVDKVHELRLSLAGEGIPNGGQVGFEIFDQTDFRTTKFVQELNFRRALQGELARTINQFKEVKSSKVFIVLPKESLFVEDRKPASASIQVDLKTNLQPSKLAAIVHLVANAVEGLDPEQVTVVDTKGRLIFKGGDREDTGSFISSSRLEYKSKLENEIRKNVQTMLEGIVGSGKAIVRVNADVDFGRVTLNQEEYDPSVPAVRSRRNIEESTQAGEGKSDSKETIINQRAGIMPPSANQQRTKTKKDEATNFEINKITRTIFKPAGTITRLSVATVIDGTYKTEKQKDGTVTNNYIPRTEEELGNFEEVVKRAMGYSEDREDQVSVRSIPFSNAVANAGFGEDGDGGLSPLDILASYKRTLINIFLGLLVFLFVIRPLLKSLRGIPVEPLPERPEELPEGQVDMEQITETDSVSPREKVFELSQNSPDKTAQLIRGWIGEQEQ